MSDTTARTSDTVASRPADKTAEKSAMPSAGFDLAGARKSAIENDGERNEVFTSLVTGDDDIVGLVAYSIYKQNKHDWLVSFNKLKNREPNDAELDSYIVGESTSRRLAIYRHLAVATLEGRGPQVNAGPGTEKFVQRNLTTATQNQPAPAAGGNAVGWIIALVVAVAAVLLAGKYGIPGLR